MTPEQRETIKDLRAQIAAPHVAGEVARHADTLRQMASMLTLPQFDGVFGAAEQDACRAGAAALAAAPACGTCRHAEKVTEGNQSMLLCRNDDALGSFKDRDWFVEPDDGCIKGYAPTEPTR